MAETRTIRTVLELNAQRFNAGAASAAASAKALSGELASISDAQGKHRADYDRVANSLLGVGAAAAAGLGLAAKASMDWESSWAGVLKTVDGTPKQLQAVEDGLRGLAKELPASHQEIAAVAEAAGQLGVETDSVVEFTRTMINLGETTNLSAEEAATGLARFSNVMGTSQDDVDRLGATLVGLGNNFETTESEILAMSMRLSGIGSQLNLSEGDVLGLSAAMSSVGIEAEAGGTAMTMGMKKIDAAVREGGDSLAGFAEVAGMSNEEFAKLWSEDSAAGLEAFVHGLSNVSEAGGDVSGTLSELGIKGIRESDTFLRLASNADGLSEALAQGNTEFERNIALVQEADKRYATTESQLKIAKNSLVDAGIEIGASVLPVLADVAGGVSDLASWFAALPEPVQRSVTGLGAMVGATGLLAGGLMKLVPSAVQTVNAFKDLKASSPQVANGLGKVAGFASRAGVAFVGLQAAGAIADQFREVATTSDEMAAGLLNAAETGRITKGTVDELVSATGTGNATVTDLANALDILDASALEKTGDFVASGFGIWDTQTEVATQQIREFDQAVTSLYTTGNVQAVSQVLSESGVAFDDLIEHMPTLKTELSTVASSMGLQATNANLMKIATGELTPVVDEATGAVTGYNVAQGDAQGATGDATGAVEEQTSALEELQDTLQGTADALLGIRGSARDFESAIDDAAKATEENGKTLDTTTEKGRANEAALDGIADAAHRYADAQVEAGASAEELDGIMSDGRQSFIDAAVAMGMGKDEAKALADELQLIPDFVETQVQVDTADAIANAADVASAISQLLEDPATLTVDADTDPAQEEVTIWGSQVGDVPIAPVIVDADTYYAEDQLRLFQQEVNAAGGTVEINGEKLNAEEALSSLVDQINAGEGTVMMNGTPVNAESALLQLIDMINGGKGTVTIDGNNVPAILKTDSAKKHADGSTGTIDVDAETGGAESDINRTARDRDTDIDAHASTGGAEGELNSTSRDRSANINASASTSAANSAINAASRTRTAYIRVVALGAVSSAASMIGRASGGWINEGLNAGGWVPGAYPGKGVDNVMWPVMQGAAGGRQLGMQPLAGTEFVVNGHSAKQWGPALEAINAGMQPSQAVQSVSASVDQAGIQAAVSAGMQGMTVALNLDGRTLYGAVVQSGQSMRRPFVTKGA